MNSKTVMLFLSKNWGIIVLVVVLIVSLALIIAYNTSEKFANDVSSVLNSVTGKNIVSPDDIKNLDIVFYINPGCPWCQKQLEVLNKERTIGLFTIKDVSNEDVAKEARAVGVSGFPYFISRTNGISERGFNETTQQIVDKLTPKNQNQVQNQQAQNQTAKASPIILMTRESCGYCKKAKEDIINKNASAHVTIMPITSDTATQIISKYNIPSGSVPIYVNAETGKYVVGFKPIEDIFKEIA